MVVPFGLEPIANLVASCLSMVSILGAPHNSAILPETMLRTHAAFEGVGAAYSISLDCAFLRRGVNPSGSGNHAYQFCCQGWLWESWGFNGSKHGVWLLWVVSPGVL